MAHLVAAAQQARAHLRSASLGLLHRQQARAVNGNLDSASDRDRSRLRLADGDRGTSKCDPKGFWQANLVPNNKISPTGTLYKVEIEGYRSYLVNVTDVGAPAIGWQSS